MMLPLPADFVGGGMLLVVFGFVVAYFRRVPGQVWGMIERNFVTRVEIAEEDESFHWMKLWLAKKLEGSLAVSVFTRRPRRDRDDGDDETDSNASLYKFEERPDGDNRPRVLFTPSPGTYFTRYGGTFCVVTRDRTEAPAAGNGAEGAGKRRETFLIRLFTRDKGVARRMIEEARDFALPDDDKIEVRVSQHSSYWTLTGRNQPRSLESVILADHIGERIQKDIRQFQQSAGWYHRLGIPYRRGYLLCGPPGNGKTSLIMAIASALRMNLYLLNLNSPLLTDAALNGLLGQVSVHSLTVMEDVDCAGVQRKAGKKDKHLSGVTFSGLLNALDGIAAQDGRIVFMTTNHVEKLDPALIRPGRVDMIVRVDNANRDQVIRLFRRFYPSSSPELAHRFADGVPDGALSMATLQGHLLQFKDSAEEAAAHSHLLQPNVIRAAAGAGLEVANGKSS
jgi:chaperone BCS1